MSLAPAAKQLLDAMRKARRGMAKPILILGGDDAARSAVLSVAAGEMGTRVMNLGIEVPAAILQQESAWTPLAMRPLLASIINGKDEAAFLDHIEVLFTPSLKLSPLDLFTDLARRTPLCVSWPGEVIAARLRYAEHGHPECLDANPARFTTIDIMKTES